MPNPTEVAIIKRDGSISLYSSYASARSNAVDYDLIQIRADLNETIILKDKVDIWIMPGVKLDNPSGVTISDKVNNISEEVHCNIFGYGKIFNSGGYSCINLDNTNSELKIECDLFDTSTGNTVAININSAAKFHLNCNSILSKGPALFLGNSGDIIEDINLNIEKVETGDPSSNLVGTSILSYATGFVNINEILCKNNGHCLLHRKGSLTARIKKITGIKVSSGTISPILVGQGDGNQKLVLYFDEINSLRGSGANISPNAIELREGITYLIGKKVYSNDGYAISITQPFPLSSTLTFANIKCTEIESENFTGIFISNVTNEVYIDAEKISGFSYNCPVYGQGNANLFIKNAYLRNRDTSSNSRCIVLEKVETNNFIPKMTLLNIKAVTLDILDGSIIFQAGFTTGVTVKNYSLFANKSLDAGIVLAIGTADNFLFTESPDMN